MFHLFKKVYLDFDDKINMSYDRVICSQDFGGKANAADLSRVFYGETIKSAASLDDLIGRNKLYPNLLAMLEELDARVDEYGSSVYVYCDRVSYYKLVVLWMKVLLPFCTANAAWDFFKSHLFKEKNFVNSKLSASARYASDADNWIAQEAEFRHYWNNTDVDRSEYIAFLEKNKSKLRLEFLIAGYLHDGRYANELAKCITPLVKKDLEKFLYEHKELILVHFQRPIFQRLLGVVNGPYTFDNFYDMVDDPSPLVQVMFKPEIWGETRSSMFSATSNDSINLSAITDEDIQHLKEFSVCTAAIWCEEEIYTSMSLRSEIDKFAFIKMLRNKNEFDTDDLAKIMEYEIHHKYHSAGSFYAIDLRSVNTYFVDHLLLNHDNKANLRPYVFEMPNET